MDNDDQSHTQSSQDIDLPKTIVDSLGIAQGEQSPRLSPNRVVYEGTACLVPELLQIGKDRFTRATPQGLDLHTHPGLYEICYIVQGQVHWWVEGTAYEVNRGDIFITHPDEIHGGLDELMHPCDLYWLIVRIPEAPVPFTGLSPSETHQLTHDLKAIDHHVFPGFSAIEQDLARILTQHRQPSSYAIPLVRTHLHQLLIGVVQAYRNYTQGAITPMTNYSDSIQQAKHWIETHLTETYHIAEVAQVVNMSTSYFHQRFLEETGFTPVEYRTWSRIEAAKHLLRSSDRSILQIAQELGFSTSQYFATVFKKWAGFTPRQYRGK